MDDATVDKTPETNMKMTETNVYSMIEDLKPYWYDLFLLLGFSHEQLAECKRKYVLEPGTAMRLLIPKWLEADNLKPSWEILVSVIRYKLLEEDVAANIEKKYCVQEEHPPNTSDKSVSDDEVKPGEIEDNNVHFSKFLMTVTEKLGPDSYVEMYQTFEEFKSPDGTRVLDDESLDDRRSNDGLVIPLIYHSIFNSRDIDFLIHMVRALHQDEMLTMAQQYLLKINMGKGSIRPLHNPNRFICIRVILLDSIKECDIPFVSVLKKDLLVATGLIDAPYLVQFLWWKRYPICLFFQAPLACSNFIKGGLSNHEHDETFRRNNVSKIEVVVNSVIVTYHY